MLRIYLIIITILATTLSNAQSIKFQTPNNINTSGINCITQDSTGFLWIGHESGFSRYDGYDLKKLNVGNLSGLPINTIKSIAYKKENNSILLGTPIGLYKYSLTYNSVAPINLVDNQHIYINDILVVDTTSYIASTIGLHILSNNFDEKFIREYSDGKRKKTLESVKHIAKDNNNNIYVTNKNGIFKLNSSNSLPTLIYNSPDISKITCIERDNCYASIIISNSKGTYLLNFNNDLALESKKEILYNSIPIRNVSDIVEDNEHNIWIGTKGEGVYKINRTWNTAQYCSSTLDHNSINSNYVNDIFIDKSNNILFSTDASINIIHSNTAFNELPTVDNHIIENVHSIYKDDSGVLLVGTKGSGLLIYNKTKDRVTKIDTPLLHTTRCFLKCKSGDFYIGTGGEGLIKAKIDTLNCNIEIIERYKANSSEESAISDNYIYTLKEDNNEDIWIGTNNGLSRLLKSERTNNKVRFLNYYHNDLNTNSPKSNIIYSLFLDSFNNIWYGTLYSGFGKIQKKEIPGDNSYESLKDYSLIFLNSNTQMHSNSVSLSGHTFAEDKDKNMWIGTDNGLIYKQFNSSNYKYYTIETGLSDNSIYATIIDNNNTLWLSTSAGINSIDLKDFTIRRFSKEDGLQSNEFNGNAYFIDNSGTLYLGGSSGVNIINTNHVISKVAQNDIAITNIRLNNRQLSSKDVDITSKEACYADTLIVKSINNTIEISVSSLNYINPTKTLYRYKIDSFNDEWNDNGYSNIINLNFLPYGEHKLNFSYKSSDGEWIDSKKGLNIFIKRPFYISTFAIIFYILFVLSFVFFLWRENRNRRELTRLFKESDDKNKMRDQTLIFFTNILHEIKSSLILITSPVENLLKIGPLNYKQQQELSSTYKNSKRLDNLIDEVISVSRLEKNQGFNLNVENINITKFLETTISLFTIYANNKSIKITFDAPGEEIYSWVDPTKLDKIIQNLITNAIKFSNKGGKIEISLRNLEINEIEFISIAITDNGIGIKEKNIPKICDRYYKVNENTEGSGIGLHLTKFYTELHSGELNIESTFGVGSTFTVNIPKESNKPTTLNMNSVGQEIIEQHNLENLLSSNTNPDILLKPKEHTMLVINHSFELLTFIKSGLESNYNVLIANDLEESIEIINKNKPNIIIADINAHQIDEIELCKGLKEAISHIDCYIIIIGSYSVEEKRKKILESGGDMYISKPFNMDYLISAVELFIDKHKKRNLESKSISNDTNIIYDNKISSISNDIALTSQEKVFIDKFNEYIKSNIINEELSVEEFAESMQMSRSNFYRTIKKITGKSPNTIITLMRMNIATELLAMNKFSISEISYKTGFSSPKYFTKVFKKHYNKTPKEYANQFK